MIPKYAHNILLFEVALVICWSSGFIGARLASDTPSIFLVLFWRFMLTALVLSPFIVISLRKNLPLKELAIQSLVGALAMFGYLAFGVKAIDLGVPLGTAALISALQPLTTAVLAASLLGEAVSRRQRIGLALGLLGVLTAVGGALGAAPIWAYLLSFLSMLSIVGATILSKYVKETLPILPTLAIQSTMAAVLFLPLAALDGSILPLFDMAFITAVAWFIIFSTVGAYGFYWICLRRSTATRVSSLIYLTPPVISIWAWLMFSEPITLLIAAGFFICMIGVWLATNQREAIS